jgi:hypothetical protein
MSTRSKLPSPGEIKPMPASVMNWENKRRGRPRKRPEPKTATQQLAEFREAEKALADRLDRVRAVIAALGG